MRKFKGFTLAEVLITLSIIGVIASVTLPALMASVRTQQVGPALAKAVNTLENGNNMILQQRGARKLDLVCPDGYLDCFQEFAHSIEVDPPVNNEPGGSPATIPSTQALQTKDGIVIMNTPGDTLAGVRNLKKYYGEAYMIRVDINGDKGPNREGSDQFTFYVDYYGTVIAHGSRAYGEYLGDGSSLWENECPNKNGANNPTNLVSCAGAIVDNGFKVAYHYN